MARRAVPIPLLPVIILDCQRTVTFAVLPIIVIRVAADPGPSFTGSLNRYTPVITISVAFRARARSRTGGSVRMGCAPVPG
jgi:hypothetical protein